MAAALLALRFFASSLLVTVTVVLLSSALALLAAVTVARFRFRTSYLIMLLTVQMLPQRALVIALYIDSGSVNLTGSLTAVYTAFALPISIWMLRNFVAAGPIYVTYFLSKGSAGWGAIMAASTLYTIPPIVFFLLIQRRMAKGLVAGAVRG